MRKLLPSFLVLVVAFPALAQEFTPTIVVQNEGKPEPLGLVGLNVEARIIGYTAETTATLTFANSQARATEGDLYFPLPEGATVSGYALDIQGQMADGSVVEKQWARTVFETEKARRVDLGLVEWTKRDCFRTRVFPIPAQGRRTVRVQYVSELADGRDGATYRLPLSFTRPIPAFALRIEVVKPASEPKVRQAAIANFHFSRWSDNFVAETKLENVLLDKELIVALPDVERQHVLVEKADDGQIYFAIHDLPPAAVKDAPPLRPKHVVIYWDASGSRAGDHEREIRLLKALLAACSESSQSLRVDLVFLRNALSPPRRFMLSDRNFARNFARLEEALKGTDYDGGTQLGALAPIGPDKPDFALLFSDGVSTFGRCEPAPLGAPLYVFSSAPVADWAVLRHLAWSSGGECFDIEETINEEIFAAVARPAYKPLPATVVDGQVVGLLASTTGPGTGHCTLVGKLESRQATIVLPYRAAGQNEQQRTFTVDAAAAIEGSLLRRLWAQKKLDDLLVHEERNEAEIVALGKEFGLVTPYTSLMVLENLQQYLQYSSKAFRHHRPPQVALQPCDTSAPYLKELRPAPWGQAFAVYMRNRTGFAHSPEFFLDCAGCLFDRQETDLAIQVLSNLAELDPNDPNLLRLMAQRLARAGVYDPAIDALEEVLRLRPNEPRSYRDLALVLRQRADTARSATYSHGRPPRTPRHGEDHGEGGSKAAIRSDYVRAVELLTAVVSRRWGGAFAEIELPALMELNRIAPAAKIYGVKPRGLNSRLIKLLDMDLRIVLTWHTGNTAMRLRVTEPSGEKAGRDHNRTTIGGLVTRLSAGDCPDEYLVRRAMNGQYVIQAICSPAAPPGPISGQVDIFTNFGRDDERRHTIVVRLKEKADTVTLGQIKF